VAYSVRTSELRQMSEEERSSALSGLVQEALASPNGEAKQMLEAQITEFERRYEVSSSRMMEELSAGKRQETAEIASWLMLIRLREEFALSRSS
jgi:hypothetical protein